MSSFTDLTAVGDGFMSGFTVFVYGFVVIGKTILTKVCFSDYSFGYPITFSLFSCLTTMVACATVFATGQAEFSSLPRHHWRGFAQISILTALDMGFTNWSLDLISVALQLTIKAAIPAIVVTYERIVLQKTHGGMAYASLTPLVLGAVLVGLGSGSADYNLFGTILMLLATLCSAIKMVTTHSVIKQVRDDMGMVSFLFWLELAMVPILLPWALANKEIETIYQWDEVSQAGAWAFVLIVALIGGLRAYSQALVLKYNAALTLAAANILIQALTILISIWVFNTATSVEMDLGIVISLIGYGMYTLNKAGKKKTAAPIPTGPYQNSADHAAKAQERERLLEHGSDGAPPNMLRI